MKINKKQFVQCKGIDTPETLKVVLAKEGFQVDDQEAEMLLKLLKEATLNETTVEALEDSELENVAGGGCGYEPADPKTYIGRRCRYGNDYGTIIDAKFITVCNEKTYSFTVQFDNGICKAGYEFCMYGFELV